MTSRRHDWMSNIAMGTIFVNGFAQRQVHTDHSTSYVPKKEIIKETQSSFSFSFKFTQMFLHRIWQKFKKCDHKSQEKSVDYYYWYYIRGYNFMILSYFFSIERDCRETEDWPVLGFFDKWSNDRIFMGNLFYTERKITLFLPLLYITQKLLEGIWHLSLTI